MRLEPTVQKAEGITATERLLGALCNRAFLSLWSYPGIFRDQGKSGTGDGKEVADHLVVFDNHVIVFSDKRILFSENGDVSVPWRRWYKKAVLAGARQVWGATRWLKDFPHRVFLDRACEKPFPYPIASPAEAVYHHVVVAHGAEERCRAELGGSGSFMIMPAIGASDDMPFAVGDLDPSKGFVHVLNAVTLPVVLDTCDTVTDFIGYLTKKEEALRSGRVALAAGEEELVAYYATHMNENNEHDFVVPGQANALILDEGHFDSFRTNEQLKRKREADRVSYVWDALIESFNLNVLAGTLYEPSTNDVSYHERGLRLLARETRVNRRLLGQTIMGLVERAREPGIRYARVLGPSAPRRPWYVFLSLRRPPGVSTEDYRRLRRVMLLGYCRVVWLTQPSVETAVGIGIEPDIGHGTSEDLIVYEAGNFTDAEREAEREAATKAQGDFEIFKTVKQFALHVSEYPEVDTPSDPLAGDRRHPTSRLEVGRNERCPCGSGRKFKRCCGAAQ